MPATTTETQHSLADALKAEEHKLLACIHCGLCLEACPTYVQTGDENDSPRGRIYLMRAVEEQRLPLASPTFTRHIDRCLGCRACESACPAGVEYGQLLEAARSDIAHDTTMTRPRGWMARLLRLMLRHVWLYPSRLRLAMSVARFIRNTRLPRLLLNIKATKLLPAGFEFALALLDSSAPMKFESAKNANHQDEVKAEATIEKTIALRSTRAHDDEPASETSALLFTGCVTEGLFARINRATKRVLDANNCTTETPRAQWCCGALHAHAGDLEGARTLARRNIEAFADEHQAHIITNAGGCGAMLASYAQLLAHDAEYAERARAFSGRVRDVSQQLSSTCVHEGATLADCSVTYDASCHLLHGQKANAEPLSMLAAIPGLRFVPLVDSDVCCGGAGIYNLVEPELSMRVLDEKLRHVEATGARIVTTGNPGCHMQLGAGARLRRGLPVQVCHPVELLDESYRRAGFYQAEKEINTDGQDVRRSDER